jgi:hypothetical protein
MMCGYGWLNRNPASVQSSCVNQNNCQQDMTHSWSQKEGDCLEWNDQGAIKNQSI